MTARSLEPGYFDELYARDSDPWRFATSEYEAVKYSATLAALPRLRYRRGVEVGCSIGVLSKQLASRCDDFLGLDLAQAALDQAAARCAALPNAHFTLSALPDTPPPGWFDLIVLSEVLYYFDLEGLTRLAASITAMARPETDLLLVHWLGATPDYPLTGDPAVAAFEAAMKVAAAVEVRQRERTPEYRLDLLRVSPATR